MEKNRKPNRRISLPKRLLTAALALLIAAGIALIVGGIISTRSNDTITVSNYEVRSEKMTGEGFRIVLISDLHRKLFDETNQQLVDIAAAQQPDVICVDGDMLEPDYTEEEADALVSLFERLVSIAPVYFAAGNHDYTVFCDFIEKRGDELIAMYGVSELRERLEATGAVFLESSMTDVTIRGEKVRIGGFYPFAIRRSEDTDESWERRRSFLEDFCSSTDFKLMLSHRPDSFTKEDAAELWDIDLVLSGHTHNGVIALPFGLGAIWTNEGFFPKHDMGIFHEGKITMVITSGLDGHNGVPRVYNPPEIAVIDVLPE